MLIIVVLPAPFGAEQAEELALLDIQAHMVERLEGPFGRLVGLGEGLE
jgi:uncharacterized protein (DUF697 family)